jgi:hypothetical protein
MARIISRPAPELQKKVPPAAHFFPDFALYIDEFVSKRSK